MKRLALPLTLLAIAGLSSCSTPPQTGGPARPGANVVTYEHPYRAGTGVVQAVMPVPGSAATGASAEPMQRLEIKMDHGGVQYVDTASREFTKGTRVQLTEDRLLKRQ